MKTILGTELSKDIRGVLYLCEVEDSNVEVFGEHLFENSFIALRAYCEIPNPTSQLVSGKTHEELVANLTELHKNIKDPKWIEELKNCL